MSENIQIYEKLVATVQNRASYRGFTFTKDCLDHTTNFINQGVIEVASRGMLKDAKLIDRMNNDLITLADNMVVEAEKMGYNELHEPTFFNGVQAIQVAGRFWPF